MWKSYEKRKGVYELKRLQKINKFTLYIQMEIPDQNKSIFEQQTFVSTPYLFIFPCWQALLVTFRPGRNLPYINSVRFLFQLVKYFCT